MHGILHPTQARRVHAHSLRERLQRPARILVDTAGLAVMIGTLLALTVLVAAV